MAKRLTKLQVDEVSVVDKGANNKRFLILKQATGDEGPQGSKSIRKTGWPSLFGRGKREKAGTPGPTDGGIEMTPEDIRKAVAEAGAVLLDPVMKRILTLEASVEKAHAPDDPPTEDVLDDEGGNDDEEISAMISEAVAKTIAPLAKRLDVIESAAGIRKSGMEEQGAHTVRKTDGSFSWEGSGLLL